MSRPKRVQLLTRAELVTTHDNLVALDDRLNNSLPLFKNEQSLLDELSFVCHYHSTGANQMLHCVSSTGLFLVMMLFLTVEPVLRPWGVPVAAVAFALPYVSLYLWFDPVVGTFIGLLLTAEIFATAYLAPVLHLGGPLVYLYLTLAFACVASLQGLGHLKFEHRAPAFRLFEFLVTTPFFCYFMFLSRVGGYRPELRDGIYQLSTQWH